MTGGIVIDAMTEEDLDEVMAIEEASFPIPWTRPLFEKELQNSHSVNLAARSPDKRGRGLVGYIVFWRVLEEIHILDLAVDPAFRNQGIGRQLVAQAVAVVKESGGGQLFLEVRRSNGAAIALYASFGFREIGHRKRYYKDGEDAVVMGLVVDNTEG